jgi:hypothetical protein
MRKRSAIVAAAALALAGIVPAGAALRVVAPTPVPVSGLGNTGAFLCGTLKTANFNSTADQPIALTLPAGLTNFRFGQIMIYNPSAGIATAAGGFYSGAGKTGVQIIASTQVYSAITASAANTSGNMIVLSPANVSYNISTVYFSLTTPEGSARTADMLIFCNPLP